MEFLAALFGFSLALAWRDLYNTTYDKPPKTYKELMKRGEFRYTMNGGERKKPKQNEVEDSVL